MNLKTQTKNEIESFNEKVYNDLNQILKILNKKFNLKIYSIIFDSKKNYCTSFRVKKTVSSNHIKRFDINQEELINKEAIFNELNISHKFDDKEFFQHIKTYFNENIIHEDKNDYRVSVESEVKENIASNNTDRVNSNNQRILFTSYFNIRIDSIQYKIVYLVEIRNLDIETLDIFYKKPYFSYLRIILESYFFDFYSLDNNNSLLFSDNIENKYNEDYINFTRRISGVFFGKIQNIIKNLDYTKKEEYKISINDLNNKYYISNFIEKINDISDRTYESSSPFGSILFLNKEMLNQSDKIEYAIKFKEDNKIELDNSKMIRKLLEMTNKENGLYLISDCESVLGLGKVRWDQLGNCVLFRVDFNGLSKYNLVYVCVLEKENERGSIDSFNDTKIYKYNKNLEIVEKKLISIFFKNPKIEEEYTCERFKSTLKRQLFPQKDINLVDNYIKKIERIVSKAREQKHGTMIVIADTDTVNYELKILKKQATLIEGMDIEPMYIKYLTSIDGAIYLDTYAKCYAVGVILDGVASQDIGDASRGARYNSAYKYYNKLKDKKCVIVIISEDGMVDIVPEIDNEENTFALVQDIIDFIKEEKDLASKILIDKEGQLRSNKLSYLDYHLYFKIADEFYNKDNYAKAYDYYLSGLTIAENENSFITQDYYFKITYSSIEFVIDNFSKENLEDIKKCIELHSKYISIFKDDRNSAIFNNRGIAYKLIYDIEKSEKFYNKAIEDYTHAINLATDDTSKSLYYHNRAYLYDRNGMYEESLKDYIECELIKDSDKIIDSIKKILDNNSNLVNNTLKYYSQRLKETKGIENNSLMQILKNLSSTCNDVSEEVAVSENIGD